MSDTPWTPGPWDQIGKEMVQQGYVVWRSNYNDATDTRVIASGIESEADARLIAAAPEMAELLEEYVALYGTQPGTLYDKAVRTLVRIRSQA